MAKNDNFSEQALEEMNNMGTIRCYKLGPSIQIEFLPNARVVII